CRPGGRVGAGYRRAGPSLARTHRCTSTPGRGHDLGWSLFQRGSLPRDQSMPQRPRARPLVSYSASAFPSCLSAVAKATVSLLAVEGARLIDRDTGALIVRIEAKRDDRIVRYAFERFGESLVVGHAARLLFGGVFGLANHANRTCDGSVLIVQGLGTLDRAADAFVLARGVAHDPERAIHIAAAVVVSHDLDDAFAAFAVTRT